MALTGSRLTDAGGGTLTFEYDEIGNVTAVTTGDGDTFHQFYDEIGRLIGAADMVALQRRNPAWQESSSPSPRVAKSSKP